MEASIAINNNTFLKRVFKQIISISKGECNLTDEMILEVENEEEQQVLQGLLFLHEDLELYKEELRTSMEAEYKIKLLEQKNIELEQFSYAASHDLQEPLRTISGFSQLLSKRYKGKLDNSADEYLEFIQGGAKRMGDLIRGLLEHSRIGSNSVKKLVDCNTLLEYIRLDLAASIKSSQSTIIYKELPIVEGDQIELRQLFQNLISNAIKFRSKERDLIIEIKVIKKNTHWCFSIKDNGIGILKENMEKIFNIFFKLHNKAEYAGSGIGLANCKRIVTHHEGTIWVESVIDQGSIFYFTIPIV